MMYWNEDKTTVDKEIFLEQLNNTLQKEAWIMDGNYASTMELRLQACDTVFFLDYPLSWCLDGIKSRKGKPRTDLPWIETEDDAEFLEFIKNYNSVSRPTVLKLLEKYSSKNICIFRERNEAEKILDKL